nr:MAG TPA: hypothetical protein [Caudoviricetes sp.]
MRIIRFLLFLIPTRKLSRVIITKMNGTRTTNRK